MPSPALTSQERAKLIRAATRASIAARNKMAQEASQELVDLYTQAAENIIQQMQNNTDADGRVTLDKLQMILSAVHAQINSMSDKRDNLLNQKISQAIAMGTEPFRAHVSADKLFGINHNAVAFVRGFTAADGLQLSDRLWRLNRGATSILADHIQHAIIHGESSFEAMQRSMGRGEGVPDDIARAYNAAKIGKLVPSVRALMTGAADPANGKGVVYQAMRVFNTEILRAHGEGYMMAGFETDGVVGVKFNLSPNHKKVDQCDTHARADNYNMGEGVYPSRDACPWPAHPNTWSFVTMVFDFEVDEYRAKKAKTPQPVAPKQETAPAQPAPMPPKTIAKNMDRVGSYDLNSVIKMGREVGQELLDGGDYESFLERYLQRIKEQREVNIPALVQGGKDAKGAQVVRLVSKLFPASWNKYSDLHSVKLNARLQRGRGSYNEATGLIKGDRFTTFVHEYAHRLQHTVPGLDDLFQDLHHRRTFDEPLIPLKALFPKLNYRVWEVTQKDGYIEPYQGKVYSRTTGYTGKHGALEVMTMAFQCVLSNHPVLLQRLVENDREMFDLVMGALFHYDP